MGCDIHGWVERKVGDKWVGIDKFNTYARERNYKRFGALANVRTDGPEPKGLPLDISDSANYDAEQWGVDGHSHSWLPLTEAAKVFCDTQYLPTATEPYWSKYPISHFFDVEDHEEEYRIVFWFDN